MKHATRSHSHQPGFSLLEVMIALAVLAISLSALIDSAGSAAANTAHLQDKTFAHWVAMNQMAELRLSKQWPKTGTTKGEAEMVGQKWIWETTTQKTPEKTMRRIDIRIRRPADPKDSSITMLTGFLRQPDT
jgi:general secretion pathway protein I